jgi:hypothetical protein
MDSATPTPPLNEVLKLLRESCSRSATVMTEAEWLNWVERSGSREWLYVVRWSENPLMFTFGSTGGDGRRLRFSGVFNSVLVGRPDYRVDFIMMRKIFGPPKIEIFEYNRPTDDRYNQIMRKLNLKHPWYGIKAEVAGDLTKSIYVGFKHSKFWKSLDKETQNLFDEYMTDVYFGRLKHPRNATRQCNWGDTVDAEFLELVNKAHLIPAIEKVLELEFPKKGFKISMKDVSKINDALKNGSQRDLNDILSEIESSEPVALLANLNKKAR